MIPWSKFRWHIVKNYSFAGGINSKSLVLETNPFENHIGLVQSEGKNRF